ncbi:MAG: S41 family peptidase [Alteraurantiacibacter sp.]
MRTSKFALTLACAAMVASCGGGGSPTPSPIATSTGGGGGSGGGGGGTAGCSLAERKDVALDLFNEWYLFPNLLDTSVSQTAHSNLQDYIDALVAPARAESKDRFFSYVTSIEEEEAFANSGATAGFGFRLSYAQPRVFIVETFEGTAALGANIDRGSEILAIGTNSSNFQTVSSLFASGGAFAVSQALGPSDPGTTRVLRIRDQAGVEREVSLTKTNFSFDPVSDRYGAQVLNDGGKRVGYINLRTFSVEDASNQLAAAFGNFRTQGVNELIVDLRYNGGGRLDVAYAMADLMGRGNDGKLFSTVAYRPSKSANNDQKFFNVRTQSIAPTRIAFIGTGSTASASELIMVGMIPYVPNSALIGSNTFGKPVGQSAFDVAACDDRYRPVTIQLENANGNGEYFFGLAPVMPATCRAQDDISRQLGDPNEAMVATALDYLAGRSCTPIAGGGSGTASVLEEGLGAPPLDARTAAQHEVPGLF